jgi:hypothetical protein
MMSNFLMQSIFNHDQNYDIENFNSKLENQSTTESERIILISKFLRWPRLDNDQNANVENFDVT